jgi:stress-induced morphogen
MAMTKYAVKPETLTKEAQGTEDQLKCEVCGKTGHGTSVVQGHRVCDLALAESMKNGK